MTPVFLTVQAFASQTCEYCLAEFLQCPSGDQGAECRSAVRGDMIQMKTTSILAPGA